MLDRLKKTVKHTAIYSLGNISNKLVGLLLLPLYTSYLTTSEYGILSIIEITSQILVGLFSFTLPQAMLRWCATEKDAQKEKSIIFSTLISLIVIASVIIGSLLPLNVDLSKIIFGNEKYSLYFLLLLIWTFLGILNKFPNSLLRLREKAVFYSFIMVSKFIVILLCNIYFVAFLEIGIEGIVWGQIIGEIYGLLIVMPFISRNIKPSYNFEVIKEMFFYGFPLAFSAVSSLLLASGDRYVLTYYLTFSSVGIYALSQKIGSLINVFLINSFQQGFLPIAFKQFDGENPKRYFQKILTYFSFILTYTALGLSFFSEEVIKLFTQAQYYEAYWYVPLICLAFVIKGINFVFTLGFHHAKKTAVFAAIIISSMFLTILLNILLIPLLEIWGAAISMVISYFTMMLLTYRSAQKLYYINYEIAKIIKLIAAAIILYLIVFFTGHIPYYFHIILKILILVSFPFLLKFIGFYDEIELLRLKQSWAKWKNPRNWTSNIKKIKF